MICWLLVKISLHDAPPSDPRCQWTFQRIGYVDTVPYTAEVAGANTELARKVREVEEAKQETAAAKAALKAAEEVLKTAIIKKVILCIKSPHITLTDDDSARSCLQPVCICVNRASLLSLTICLGTRASSLCVPAST
jgi:hypothetical protein